MFDLNIKNIAQRVEQPGKCCLAAIDITNGIKRIDELHKINVTARPLQF